MTDMEMYESVDDILESQDKTKPSSNEHYETLQQTHQKKASTCSFSTTACQYSCLLLLVVASTSLSIATFVLYTTDESIDGSWSSWATWEACSTTCDAGMQKRGRNCSNPDPRGTGRQCLGTDIEVRLCQSEPCRMEQTSTKGPSENVVAGVVSFHAFKAADLLLSQNQTIVFQESIMNEGRSYNSATGIFTAPFSGVYQFSVHLCAQKARALDYALMLGGRYILRGFYREEDNRGTCTSFSVPVIVKQNEKVWVVYDGTTYTTNRLYQDDDDWNTFSGVLIRELN